MQAIKEWLRFCHFLTAAVVLMCLNTAVAQVSYRVSDLGFPSDFGQQGVFGCAMGLNNHGWTEAMEGYLDANGNFVGRAAVNAGGLKLDLGTLGGSNSFINWGGINDHGDAVGLAETSVPDPNGEDVCGFGTQLTCRPFIWQAGQMSALPTLGGNNGQASAINSRGQVVGVAENSTPDSTCVDTNQVFQTKPVIWNNGVPQELSPASGDPDGIALGINDLGQTVGNTGICGILFGTGPHAVLWDNGSAVELPNLGGNAAFAVPFAINNQGHIVGGSNSPDGSTFYAVLWQNRTIIKLGTVPGDFAAFASGINDKRQVVGTSFDANFNLRAFIWQNGVMTDLNKLFPVNSNLYATMANKINSRGQISGMATVLSGPNAGQIHAFLATPVNASIGASAAAFAATHGKPAVPANVQKQLWRRFGLGRFVQ
jgi:probable HAF family extracellular repeat protein